MLSRKQKHAEEEKRSKSNGEGRHCAVYFVRLCLISSYIVHVYTSQKRRGRRYEICNLGNRPRIIVGNQDLLYLQRNAIAKQGSSQRKLPKQQTKHHILAGRLCRTLSNAPMLVGAFYVHQLHNLVLLIMLPPGRLIWNNMPNQITVYMGINICSLRLYTWK